MRMDLLQYFTLHHVVLPGSVFSNGGIPLEIRTLAAPVLPPVALLDRRAVSGIKPLIMEGDDHRNLCGNSRERADIEITTMEVVKMNKMGFKTHDEKIL
jgi:hypothetical protein